MRIPNLLTSLNSCSYSSMVKACWCFWKIRPLNDHAFLLIVDCTTFWNQHISLISDEVIVWLIKKIHPNAAGFLKELILSLQRCCFSSPGGQLLEEVSPALRLLIISGPLEKCGEEVVISSSRSSAKPWLSSPFCFNDVGLTRFDPLQLWINQQHSKTHSASSYCCTWFAQ